MNRGNIWAVVAAIVLLFVTVGDIYIQMHPQTEQVSEGQCSSVREKDDAVSEESADGRSKESEDQMSIEKNVETLTGCTPDKAQMIVRKFEEAVGASMEAVTLVPTDKKSCLLEAVAGGVRYYLKVTSRGMLREIREGDVTGKVIYQVNY